MPTTDKLQGTCSVCLRAMQLFGPSPIRHGFNAVGVHHGQTGGFHTGPCAGVNFPHLGISTEGTKWALSVEREHLASAEEKLAWLATNPELIWYPRLRGSHDQVRGGLPDMDKPVKLNHDDPTTYNFANDGRPTYANEHGREVFKAQANRDRAQSTIKAYEKVLANWSPAKYPTSGAEKKPEIVHLATPRTHVRHGNWIGIKCRSTRPGYASEKIAKSDDPSKVTCKKCRKDLGLS